MHSMEGQTFLLTLIGVTFGTAASQLTPAQTVTTVEPLDENCLVNKSLPRTEKGNWVDCTTEEQVKQNKTQCCEVDGSVGCCDPGGGLYAIVDIGIAIGCSTAGLMLLVFLVFWCNKQTFPCLEKLEKRCGCKCKEKIKALCKKKQKGGDKTHKVARNETRVEMRPNTRHTSSPDDGERPSTSGSGGSKTKHAAHAAHAAIEVPPPEVAPVYDMPEELKMEVKDDFWGTV